jgi:tetratricopeptide (TPR) repeat protein
MNNGRLDRICSLSNELMDISESKPESWISKAITASISKSPSQSVILKYIDKAISLNKHHLFAHQIKGFYLSEFGQTDESVKSFRNAYKISRDVFTYEGLVLNYIKQKRLEEALKLSLEAVTIFPKVTYYLTN